MIQNFIRIKILYVKNVIIIKIIKLIILIKYLKVPPNIVNNVLKIKKIVQNVVMINLDKVLKIKVTIIYV